MGEKKLGKKELATLTGLDVHTISDWYYERIASMKIDTLVKLCAALGITDMNDLFTLEPESEVNKQ